MAASYMSGASAESGTAEEVFERAPKTGLEEEDASEILTLSSPLSPLLLETAGDGNAMG